MKKVRAAWQRFDYRRHLPPLLVIGLVVVLGVALLLSSHAATPVVSLEAENGTLSGNVSVASDSTASGGQYIQFGTATMATPPPPPPTGASSTTPCVGAAPPTQWKHVVVLMFENQTYGSVVGNSAAPWISSMASKCGTYANWHDADYRVDGTTDGSYHSKPNYATLTSGVPPSVSGLKDDTYSTTSSVDNIYNRLNQAGITAKDYYDGSASSTPCVSSNFSGAYHDPMRYFTDIGAQSSSTTTYCNTHDVPLSQFMTDVNNNTLPAYSFILPTNSENMHDNSVSSGDAWAQAFLVPFLDSARYKSGDTALFFLWDEDTPIPNVLLAPSIKPGTHPVSSNSYAISHYSALRTWQEMLGVSPLLGTTGQAPSLLSYYNGQ